MTGSHEVRGSIPLGSTNPLNNYRYLTDQPERICVPTSCSADAQWVKVKRTNVGAAFFLFIESQQRAFSCTECIRLRSIPERAARP